MSSRPVRVILAQILVAFSSVNVASSREQAFHLIGDLPGGNSFTVPLGVSADGSTVVGVSHSGIGLEAFVWTAHSGMRRMPSSAVGHPSYAWDVSRDGSVIVGAMQTSTGEQPFRWSEASGYEILSLDVTGSQASAHAVSDDGSVIAIDAYSASFGSQCYLWTPQTGPRSLGGLPWNFKGCDISDVSGDGTTIVGNLNDQSYHQQFRWTQEQGFSVLDRSFGGLGATAVSFDGKAVVGSVFAPVEFQTQASIWTERIGIRRINTLPPHPTDSSHAYDVTADGLSVHGEHLTLGAFVWDRELGMRSLQSVLADEFGLGDQIGSTYLKSARGVSADGRVITGTGIGNDDAWVAIVPEPGGAHLAAVCSLATIGWCVMRKRRGRTGDLQPTVAT